MALAAAAAEELVAGAPGLDMPTPTLAAAVDAEGAERVGARQPVVGGNVIDGGIFRLYSTAFILYSE